MKSISFLTVLDLFSCIIFLQVYICDSLFETDEMKGIKLEIPFYYPKLADNCTDKFAKAHACKLLELNNQGSITLWNRHPSGVKDNATALDNIRDACNGTAASRSHYTCSECPKPGAPGGTVCLQDILLRYMLSLAAKVGYIHVNEIAGACHTCRSLHYQGRAVDIDPTKSKTKAQDMIDLCFDMQGIGINETNHIHCSFAKF